MIPIVFTSWLVFSIFVIIIYLSRSLRIKNVWSKRMSIILSQISFGSFWRLALIGWKRNITKEDLDNLDENDKSANTFLQWQLYESETTFKRNSRSIVLATLLCFKNLFLLAFLLNITAIVLQFVGPQILRHLLLYVQDPTMPMSFGLALTIFMFLREIAEAVCEQQQCFIMFLISFRLKSSLVTSIYSKTLRLAEQNSGVLVSLVANDVQRIVSVIPDIQIIWTAPLQIVLALYFLWITLGWPTLIGFCVTIIFVPINFYLSKLENKFEMKRMNQKEIRMSTLSEMLNGIKMIKLYAWEMLFQDKLNKTRGKEIKIEKVVNILKAAKSLVTFCAPLMVAIVSFSAFVLSDSNNTLNPQIAFVSLSLFNILRHALNDIPSVISELIQANVSLKTLEEFLSRNELKEIERKYDSFEQKECGEISINNGCFKHGHTLSNLCLTDINMYIQPGQLVAVIGEIGMGKSAFLLAVLGELHKVQGSVTVTGSVAYVPQQAWIRNCTVRDNIIFKHKFNSQLYQNVLQACALEQDILTMPNLHDTIIGEKGVNLSGGQKQRISLARAVYSDSDIYLLDDPLSAVDVHVGRHIFDHVISHKGILRAKTRIFVTHNRSYIESADVIIVVKDGRINVIKSFQDFERTCRSDLEYTIDNEGNKRKEKQLKKVTIEATKKLSLDGNQKHISLNQNDVSWEVYPFYAKIIGLKWLIGSCLLFVISASFGVASNMWLAKWTRDSSKNTTDLLVSTQLSVLFTFGFLEGLIMFLAALLMACVMTNCSARVHNDILDTVLKCPLRFFDITPMGATLNWFGSDIESIDSSLPTCIQELSISSLKVFSTLLIVVIGSPAFVLVIIPLAFAYYFIQKFYISTVRQLNVLTWGSSASLLSYLSESGRGSTSIRAYKAQRWSMNVFFRKVDECQMYLYPTIISNRWLTLHLLLFKSCVVLFAALLAVLLRDHTTDASLLGLALTCASTQIMLCKNLPSEAERKTKFPLPDTWPNGGQIEFQNYSTGYSRDSNLSLKNINCAITESEKVGIVGRTGAGKSSLSLALFRIIEAFSGKILIDKIDISTVGLHDLRTRMAIIPQDPVLFSGTVRMNLDPFNKYQDAEIWQTLEYVGLKSFVSQLVHKLHHIITENGTNFSVGQCQLICLARGLLKKSKILILDEATAAVDFETENLILQSIEKVSNDCTILTIAHRLKTIIGTDRIIVLGDGRILEYEKADDLLKRNFSVFS